jgi:hypothetical protein
MLRAQKHIETMNWGSPIDGYIVRGACYAEE